VVYYSIFHECLIYGSEFIKCPGLPPGIISSVVMFMVFIKNSLTLKDFKERAFIFPIITNESFLYHHHIIKNESKNIVSDFIKFNSLDENWEPSCTTEPTYSVIINFGILVMLDLAAIASVSSLIIVSGDTPFVTFLRVLPFLGIILLDILSESVILFTHDIPLCNQEEENIKEYDVYFRLARTAQLVVQFCWIVVLIYMIVVTANLDCRDECQCHINVPGLNCTSPSCPPNSKICQNEGICEIKADGFCTENGTVPFSLGSHIDYYFTNCTVTKSAKFCYQNNPSVTSCILLGLVILEGFYQIIGMFFRSYIYPITLPETILFFMYWMNRDTEKLLLKVGKFEFGLDWKPDLDMKSETTPLYTFNNDK